MALRYVDPEDSGRHIEVKIAPEVGNNLFSLAFGGRELLVTPDPLRELANQHCGIKILYPTPNRMKNAEFRFDGAVYRFPQTSEPHFMHGLAKSMAWTHAEPEATDRAVTLRTWIDFDETKTSFKLFPFSHRIGLDFILTKEGIAFRYSVLNSDAKRLPFGFGIHPYFRVLGRKESIDVRIPAGKRMDAVDKIPTGKLLPMDSDRGFDLREFTSIADLDMDDVFFGLKQSRPAEVQYRDAGIRLRFIATDDFTHGVLFTPQKDFYCFENQTCSTDAHNLYDAGFKEASHLLIVEPGECVQGMVKIELGKIYDRY